MMKVQAIDSKSFGLLLLSALGGILIGYLWDAQFWNPIAHRWTKGIVGTGEVTGWPIALALAFVFGITRSLMGCSNVFVLALPILFGRSKTPKEWYSGALLFISGAVIIGAVLGAVFGAAGAVLLEGLSSVASKVTMASVVQTAVGALILGLALLHLGLIPFPGTSLNLHAKNPFMLGLVSVGLSTLGCPSPINYALLIWVATTENIVFGALVLAVHTAGRALPALVLGTALLRGVGFARFARWLTNHNAQMRLIEACGLAMMGMFLISYWLLFLDDKFPLAP